VFLFYRNQGERQYGDHPVQPYPRGRWEFQFFLEGEFTVVLQHNGIKKNERLKAPMLILTGPDCIHGWGGKPGDHTRNIIFHFDEAEYPIRSIVGADGYRRVPFQSSEIPVIQALYDRCGEARKRLGTTPLEVSKRAGFWEPLIYKIVAAELTIFFLKHIPKTEWGVPPNYGESKVKEAMAWYEANMSKAPNIAEVARAIHLSPTHLRRLFHKVRGTSPQLAFTHVQFERAKWLMRSPDMTLEQVGESTGFGSASAFSRAFKTEFGMSPREFRQKSLGKLTKTELLPVAPQRRGRAPESV